MRKVSISPALTGTAGAATGNEEMRYPLNGRVLAVHIDVGTQPATLDVTIKVVDHDLPVLTLENVGASGWYFPRIGVHSTAGAALEYAEGAPMCEAIPFCGYVNVAGAGGNAGSFTVTLLIED